MIECRRVSLRAVSEDSSSVRLRPGIGPKFRPPCTVRRYRWKTTWRQWRWSALGGFALRQTVRRVPITTAGHRSQCESQVLWSDPVDVISSIEFRKRFCFVFDRIFIEMKLLFIKLKHVVSTPLWHRILYTTDTSREFGTSMQSRCDRGIRNVVNLPWNVRAKKRFLLKLSNNIAVVIWVSLNFYPLLCDWFVVDQDDITKTIH